MMMAFGSGGSLTWAAPTGASHPEEETSLDIQALQLSLRRYADELLRFADQTAIALAASPGAKTHVLIDWENVQPTGEDVLALVPEATDLWLFHGPNQKMVGAHHAGFGERATPIRIARTGKNALDFHLSFYIGYIASRQPEARFVVISNDKGYEPMLDHAEELGFAASRIGFARQKALRAPAKRGAAKKAAVPARKAAAKRPAAKKSAPAKRAAPAKKATPAKTVAAKKAPSAKPSGRPSRAAKSRAAAPQTTTSTTVTPVAASRSQVAKKTFEQMLAMLQKRPMARLPRKPAGLLADIAQMIGAPADGAEAAAMLERLVASGRIFVEGNRVARYAL